MGAGCANINAGTGTIPPSLRATVHWWGLYKFAHAGVIRGDGYEDEAKAWGLAGEELADVDSKFYRDFKPDMFHLSAGASRMVFSAAETAEFRRLSKAVADLDSYAVIDEYVEAAYPDKERVLKSGVFDHVKILAKRHGSGSETERHGNGSEAVLMLNEGNPVSWVLDPHGCVGFENGLIALIEKPDMMEYLLYKCYRALLPRMAALKAMGAHGYIGSETYCGADLIAPGLYRQIIFGPQREFYCALREMGLIAVCYFLGDVLPLMPYIRELGIDGLMVEEGKKNFDLDIGKIYRELEGTAALFGNLDSVYILQKGSPEEVVAEVRRQVEVTIGTAWNAESGGGKGRFIISNGCPISFGTPLENIHAMLGCT